MKNLLKISLLASFIATSITYAQCGPVTIPPLLPLNDVYGGAFCLQGEGTFGQYCISNDLNTNQTNTFLNIRKTGVTPILFQLNEGKLSLGGNYPVNSSFDLSFDFYSAGSAKIRTSRGLSWDTYIQFLTNSINKGSDSPEVRMQINEDGRITIGNVPLPTSAPYKLYVQGGILTEKLKVALSGNTSMWADYVFDPNYKLKTLYEVEEFINLNKHLPNIPSSEDIKKEGIEVPEMLSKQMEKIEELTLYLIEMKKDIDALKLENQNLKEKLTTLKE